MSFSDRQIREKIAFGDCNNMKLMPFALLFASAIFCSTIRNRIDPTPTPLPNLGDVPTPMRTATPTPTPDGPSQMPPANATGSRTVSGGVLNGKAKVLPKPEYPPAAKAVRAAGPVTVEVLVDEMGKVVSATAVSGHPLLRAAAVQAARKAEFSPTLLAGKVVKLSGVLTFNFTPE